MDVDSRRRQWPCHFFGKWQAQYKLSPNSIQQWIGF
jgi:hypothetical protein